MSVEAVDPIDPRDVSHELLQELLEVEARHLAAKGQAACAKLPMDFVEDKCVRTLRQTAAHRLVHVALARSLLGTSQRWIREHNHSFAFPWNHEYIRSHVEACRVCQRDVNRGAPIHVRWVPKTPVRYLQLESPLPTIVFRRP